MDFSPLGLASARILSKNTFKLAATIKGHQRQQFKNVRSTSKDHENTHADGLLVTASNLSQQHATLVDFPRESTVETKNRVLLKVNHS
jgi:hypothetical protein